MPVAEYAPAIPALLTRASRLAVSAMCVESRAGLHAYRPKRAETSVAARLTLASEVTSISTSETVPGRARALRSERAVWPLEGERAPRRTMFEASAMRSWARARPMPLLAGVLC